MKSEYQKANDAALKKLISQLKGSKEEQLDFLSNERKKRTDELRKEDPKIDIQNHPELDAYGMLYQSIANDQDPKVEYKFEEDEEPKEDAPSFDAYMDARRHIDKLRDTYKKQKEEYDTAQRMNWAENAKKEGSRLNPMYGLKPNDFENTSDYKKYVDTITSYEKANNHPSWLEENPFETMYSKKEEIDTNDNGKIEEDELSAYTKDLEDYLEKNPKAKDKNYY